MRPHPGGDREPGLLRTREPDLRPEDVVVAEHDAAEELLVDEPHRLGRRERLAILLGEEEARAPVVLACARALERHHLAERLRAVTDEHVLLAAPEAAEVGARQVDATAARVLRDVAQDVRQLEREPELDRVLARRRALVAEDLDADEANRARNAVAVSLEIALPRLVALAVEIHLDAVDDGGELLARDREALDRVGERDADRVARPPRVDGFELFAPAREQSGSVARRAVVGDVVG